MKLIIPMTIYTSDDRKYCSNNCQFLIKRFFNVSDTGFVVANCLAYLSSGLLEKEIVDGKDVYKRNVNCYRESEEQFSNWKELKKYRENKDSDETKDDPLDDPNPLF